MVVSNLIPTVRSSTPICPDVLKDLTSALKLQHQLDLLSYFVYFLALPLLALLARSRINKTWTVISTVSRRMRFTPARIRSQSASISFAPARITWVRAWASTWERQKMQSAHATSSPGSKGQLVSGKLEAGVAAVVDEGENRARKDRASTVPRGQLLSKDEDGGDASGAAAGKLVAVSEAGVEVEGKRFRFGEAPFAAAPACCSYWPVAAILSVEWVAK